MSTSLRDSTKKGVKLVGYPVLILFLLSSITQVLPMTAYSLLLVNELNIQPSVLNTYYATSFLPWSFKVFYGVWSDNVPLLGSRRRSYVILCLLLSCLLTWTNAAFVNSVWMMFATAIPYNVAFSFSEIVLDSIVVEAVNKDTSESSSVQSLCMSCKTLGSIFASVASIVLHAYTSSPRMVIAIAGCSPLIGSFVASKLQEDPIDSPLGVSHLCKLARDTFCHRNSSHYTEFQEKLSLFKKAAKLMIMPLLFVFVLNSVPTAGDTTNAFIFSEFAFEQWELSLFNFVGLIGSLLGTLLYWKVFGNSSIRIVFVLSTILSTLSSATQIFLVTRTNEPILGIPDMWFIGGDGFLINFCSRIAFMPVIVLAVQSCPHGLEATVYALFLSITDVAGPLSAYLSAIMTAGLKITKNDWSNLWIMITITCSLRLLPLLLLPGVPSRPLAEEFDQLQHRESRRKSTGSPYLWNGSNEENCKSPLVKSDAMLTFP